MRKLTLLSLAAFTSVMMAGVPAMTSEAAVYTYRIGTGGQNFGSGQLTGSVFGGNNCGAQAFGNGNHNCLTFPEDCVQTVIPGTIMAPSIPGGTIIQPGGTIIQPGGNTSQPGGNTGQPDNQPEAGSYAEEVLALVNAERAKAGVGALTLDSNAQQAAEIRAAEIRQSFSHTRPDGRDFGTALTEAGVRYTASGENIAYGQNSPEEVMRGWMNSEGHRANILNGSYTSIGIGHIEDAAGTDYWVQLFFR